MSEQSKVAERQEENPFTPGWGGVPPKLAGRARERSVLDKAMRRLTPPNSKAPVSNIVVSAPRGFGKTAMLKHLVQQEHTGAQVVMVSANRIGCMADLMRKTLGDEAVQSRSETSEEHFDASLKFAGSGGGAGGSRGGATETPPMSVDQWTAKWQEHCAGNPTLMVVDEAHTLDLDVARHLFNAVQDIAGNKMPLALCIMGTPDMDTRLSGANATFWPRGASDSNIKLPPLSRDESMDAVRAPLEDENIGMSIDDDALNEIVEHAHGYPFFLQLWGATLFDLAAETGEKRITRKHVEMARRAVEGTVSDHYKAQLNELKTAMGRNDRNKLGALVALAGALLSSPDQAVPAGSMEYIAGKALRDMDVIQSEDEPSLVDIACRAGLMREARHYDNGPQKKATIWLAPAIPSLLAHVVDVGGEQVGPEGEKALEGACALVAEIMANKPRPNFSLSEIPFPPDRANNANRGDAGLGAWNDPGASGPDHRGLDATTGQDTEGNNDLGGSDASDGPNAEDGRENAPDAMTVAPLRKRWGKRSP